MAREGRALKKVNKVLKRVEKHIDDTREALEDLEIEFDVLKATIERLKASMRGAEEENEPTEEELDIEKRIQRFNDAKVLIHIIRTSSRADHMSSQCARFASSPGGWILHPHAFA